MKQDGCRGSSMRSIEAEIKKEARYSYQGAKRDA
jgi:hypothetical protein